MLGSSSCRMRIASGSQSISCPVRNPRAKLGLKHFAAELGERGVRVNAVAPGVVDTDMSKFARSDAGRDFTLGIQALKRIAKPDDIADVVAFLASDSARWITGDTVRVDGGSKL